MPSFLTLCMDISPKFFLSSKENLSFSERNGLKVLIKISLKIYPFYPIATKVIHICGKTLITEDTLLLQSSFVRNYFERYNQTIKY